MPKTGSLSRSHLERLRHIYFNNSDSEIQTMALSELLYQSTRPAPDRRHQLEVPMMLIEIRNAQGRHAWCDAQCYDADGQACTCPCAGANHAKGLAIAISNMPAIVENGIPQLWIEQHADDLPPDCKAYAQLPLWVEVDSYQIIAGIARQLQEARLVTTGSSALEPLENTGTE